MELNICRLCLSQKFLSNLYHLDDEVRLDTKISFCLDVKLHPKDNFPVMICHQCKRKIQKFYKFKQNCLKIDLELRKIMTKVSSLHGDFGSNYLSTESQSSSNEGSPKAECIMNDNICSSSNIENELTSTVYEIEITPINQDRHITTQCDICGSTFHSMSEFKSHRKSHVKSRRYECDICFKLFTRAENKAIHERSHLGIRPFVCDICGQTATKRQDLTRHKKIHTDVKDYECQVCGRCFKRSGDLSTHLRTHTGARPYSCKICSKSYTSHSGLRKHVKSHA